MSTRFLTVMLSICGLGALLFCGSAGRTEDQPAGSGANASQETSTSQNVPADLSGVQVQTRGPVHEAFAEPVIRAPQLSPVIPKKPPDVIQELPPDQKPAGKDVEWIPGYWAWDNDSQDFLWVSGVWRVPPPGRQWVPGYWNQVDNGWQWVAGFWAPVTEQNTVEYLPEPLAPINEAIPPAPDDVSTFVPGCWVWRDTRYLWRPGFWIRYRPGWMWVSACYMWTPSGWVFVDGYWDLPFQDRGLLFAPVFIQRRLWTRPGWFYRPMFAVYNDFLFGALFIRMANCHYYFGDYFGPTYADAGFIPWINFRIGQRFYDPLFTYYRWLYRGNRTWMQDLNALYAGRIKGTIARPPRTLVQQTTLVKNVYTTKGTNVKAITVVGSLGQMNNRIVKLQTIPKAQMQQLHSRAVQFQKARQQRTTVETRLAKRPPSATGGTVAQRIARLNLPKPLTRVKPLTSAQTPPPPPKQPRPQLRTLPNTGRGASTEGSANTNPPTRISKPVKEKTKPDTGKPSQERPKPVRPSRPPEERPKPPPRPSTNRPPAERPKPTPRPSTNRPPAERPKPPPRPSTNRAPDERPKPTPRPSTNRAPDERPKPPPRPSTNRPPDERPKHPPQANNGQPPAVSLPGNGRHPLSFALSRDKKDE